MRLPASLSIPALGLIFLGACAHEKHHSAAAQPEPPAKLRAQIETFTGEIVRGDGGYRFKPANEPEKLQRLTRAKQRDSFVQEEINLRKYFGKTLNVKGTRENEWIWGADIIGQWLRPGEKRSATLTGPEPQ